MHFVVRQPSQQWAITMSHAPWQMGCKLLTARAPWKSVENSRARPADVFTKAAVPGRDAALDVSIVAQDAVEAGTDCCRTAYRRKVQHYRDILTAMNNGGIAFRPMIWSAEGRPHPVAKRVMGFAGDIAARRRPQISAKEFIKRWEREIAIAIQRRLSRMIKACLPKPSRHSEWLMTGHRPV